MKELLFYKLNLSSFISLHEMNLENEVDSIDGNELLQMSVDDLCAYLIDKYTIHTPKLLEEHIHVDQEETNVDVRNDPLRLIHDRSRPVYIAGTKITYFIPFEGDKDLFNCRPSTSYFTELRGEVIGNEMRVVFEVAKHDPKQIKSEFETTLSQIKQYLIWIENEVIKFNNFIEKKARVHIEARREKLLKDRDLVAALGYPLKKREGMSETYVVSPVRKKVIVKMPEASTAAFVPEPVLEMQTYEEILTVLLNMVLVMERSPKTFQNMKEESLRQHFLVQLNGMYEGKATGETFNFEGKTDILLRENNKNLFIAECLIWRGPEYLREKMDQLLNYTSWRDTKTAILIFNRTKKFTDVLQKIPKVVEEHPNCKKRSAYPSETGFRYLLHHRDDKNRELILTVLAFEIPGATDN